MRAAVDFIVTMAVLILIAVGMTAAWIFLLLLPGLTLRLAS